MTGLIPPFSQAGPPPEEPPGGRDGVSLAKAFLLVVVAVVLGVLLLAVGSRPPTDLTASQLPTSPTVSTTTVPAHKATTTTTTIVKSSVKVLAANGTTLTGVAEFFTQKLQTQGWQTLTPVDTTSNVTASNVYYAAGQEAAAAEIAQSLGLKASAIQPLTTSVPVQGTTGVDVVLVVGPDLGAQDSAATTTTT